MLHKKGILRRIYTQNIDGLEYLGGVPNEKIIEAHGTFKEAYCQACNAQYDLKWLKDAIFMPEKNDGVPKCEKCKIGTYIHFWTERIAQTLFYGVKLP